jgi:hypothetical protein
MVYRLAAVGDYARAIDFIYRWQGYDEHQVASLFLDNNSEVDLMEISPLLIAAAALFEAPEWGDEEEQNNDDEEEWKQWQAKLYHLMKIRPVEDSLHKLLEVRKLKSG